MQLLFRSIQSRCWIGLILLSGWSASAQQAQLRPADPIHLPALSDSNSPSQWSNEQFMIYQSYALPLVATGSSQTDFLRVRPVLLNSFRNYPLWIEATWVDDDGTVYAWYHHESWVCPPLAVPSIGALVSHDGGFSFQDQGIILESGYANDCNSKSQAFAGGHGDFTVLLDPARQYFYFYFTNYSGPLSSQGIAAARMAFRDRAKPAGRVWKFYQNSWSEPGRHGRVSAMLPAAVSWSRADTDSFWGPSLHWNTYLNEYVMLLNHSCCSPGWHQEGIYISFNPDLSNPHGWTSPQKILDGDQARWYPQVIGLEPGSTDKIADKEARFFMGADSEWVIDFSLPGEDAPGDNSQSGGAPPVDDSQQN